MPDSLLAVAQTAHARSCNKVPSPALLLQLEGLELFAGVRVKLGRAWIEVQGLHLHTVTTPQS